MKSSKNSKEDEIIKNIDRAIVELVYDKHQIIKAYNYYHGKRDPEQFRHLEENYGIGTPTAVEFIPLVRKHIDVLVGEYLSVPTLPKVSCKDSKTLSIINNEKKEFLNTSLTKELNKYIKDILISLEKGDEVGEKMPQYNKIIEDLKQKEVSYISKYEIAGQNIIDYCLKSQAVDFINKRRLILLDILVSGTCYFQVIPSEADTNVNFRILNPINTFVDRNPNSEYLKESGRAVIREYLTKQQILKQWGHLLSKDEIDELDSLEEFGFDGTTTYLRSYDSVLSNYQTDGILGGFEVTTLVPSEINHSKYFRTYPVYYVEWLQADKENGEYISNRYEGVRIGSSIYIPTGKSKNMVRSADNPKTCSLSINGIFFGNRNGDPISLILSTANLQDR